MTKIELLAVSMPENMMDDLNDKPEETVFPFDKSIKRNPANMIWNIGLNAMAYGFKMGLGVAGLTLDDVEVEVIPDLTQEGTA